MDNIGDVLNSSLDLHFLFKVETRGAFLALFDDTGRAEIVTIKMSKICSSGKEKNILHRWIMGQS